MKALTGVIEYISQTDVYVRGIVGAAVVTGLRWK